MSIFPEPALIFDAINGIIPEGEGNPVIICAYKVLKYNFSAHTYLLIYKFINFLIDLI